MRESLDTSAAPGPAPARHHSSGAVPAIGRARIAALQRSAGNRAVLGVLRRGVMRCPSCGGTCGDGRRAFADDVTLEEALTAVRPVRPGAEELLSRSTSPRRAVSRAMLQRAPWDLGGDSAAGVMGALVCAYPFFSYALDNFPDKSDKWKHCWVSCKIQFYCGNGVGTALIGAGKEAADWVCDQFGGGCKAEWADFVADLKGIACGNELFSTCASCCDSAT